MKQKVFVKLPRAGLGNMLLTWSRGYVFSKINNFELHTSYWAGIRPGAWLRMENRKRLYFGYFKEDSLVKQVSLLFHLLLKQKILEPEVAKVETTKANTVFVFNKIFIEYDFFKEIRPYKKTVKEGIFQMLTPNLQIRFKQYEQPVIGIHVRRGDFKIGSTITPLSFFAEVIENIRFKLNEKLPVTVFTDANKKEIEPLLELGEVKIAEQKPDVLDLLILASSRIVILSIGSTFSYWAGFLSDGIIIRSSADWHTRLSEKYEQRELLWDKNVNMDWQLERFKVKG